MSNVTKIEVTFKTKTGHTIIEIMDKNKGSNLDYKLRAMALNWQVVAVKNLG